MINCATKFITSSDLNLPSDLDEKYINYYSPYLHACKSRSSVKNSNENIFYLWMGWWWARRRWGFPRPARRIHRSDSRCYSCSSSPPGSLSSVRSPLCSSTGCPSISNTPPCIDSAVCWICVKPIHSLVWHRIYPHLPCLYLSCM